VYGAGVSASGVGVDMSNYWVEFLCAVCGEGFTLEQWDVRHTGRNGEEYHEECCPECKDGTAYDDDDDDIPGGFDFAEDVNYMSDY